MMNLRISLTQKLKYYFPFFIKVMRVVVIYLKINLYLYSNHAFRTYTKYVQQNGIDKNDLKNFVCPKTIVYSH